MKRRVGFTLIELLVVVSVIAVLIAILLPSLSKARKRARAMVCMTNEKYLVTAYRIYFQDVGTVLSSTGHGTYGAWDFQLLGTGLTPTTYYSRNGRGGPLDTPRFCPETTRDRRFSGPQVGQASLAWDCRVGPGGGSTGSYGMNNWMYNGNNYQARSNPRPTATDFYKIKNTSSEFQIPVFVDCVWHDFLPRATDLPGVNLQDPESGTSADRSLADVAIDRHNRAVNVGFWDAHVEPVKLTNLWTLKWSPTWTRADPQQIK